MVTAWNPYSVARGRLRNALANALLWPVLRAGGPVLASLGYEPGVEGTWREPGFAQAATDVDRVRRIGARFGQHAIFLVRPEGREVLACAS